MLVVDLSDPPPLHEVNSRQILIGVGEPSCDLGRDWLQCATFTLTSRDSADRRTVRVAAPQQAAEEIAARCRQWPQASDICDDVLRALDPDGPTRAGIVTESLGYSTLQSGPEFARWLAGRGQLSPPQGADPVVGSREGGVLRIAFNRPQRHNAFANDVRAALLELLTVAVVDDTVEEVVLTGNGESFCSGGDLAEFGGFADPATAHLARIRHSPGLLLATLTERLGRRCRAEIHGQVLGSGLEMAAFCGWVSCRAGAVLGLPELSLGLIPGAGGTVSLTRRIGRWRTAYLILSGHTIDAGTALSWGLVDEVV